MLLFRSRYNCLLVATKIIQINNFWLRGGVGRGGGGGGGRGEFAEKSEHCFVV